ncbi:MAG: putative selenate ABC transporter substrate-binding protein [Gammaproteobacteria bacterium]|nr:putative selenate ABC transporter substrate-binding protein [Gammaproteobacteria bacterium]
MKWLIGMVSWLFIVAAAGAETLYFTAIPDQDETRLQQRFDAVAEYLSDYLQVDVRFVPVKSYAASVSAFRNNQVQLAWFGGLSGVRAQQMVAGSRAIAQGEEDPEFRSYFIANVETGLEPGDALPAGLRGLNFTFGSRGSTSGRLMPEYFLRQRFDQAPEAIFERVGFSGNHSRTAALVESGAYDAGALNYRVWDTLVADGEVDTDRVQVIWETPTYPDYHWVIRGDVNERFGEGFADRVQQAFLDMDDPELLERFPRQGFIPADNHDFRPVLETARELDLIE